MVLFLALCLMAVGIYAQLITPDAVVVTSFDSSCALYNDDVRCWGNNAFGNLGLGDTDNRYKPEAEGIDFGDDFTPNDLSCGGYHCCVVGYVDVTYTMKCWGDNGDGQLGYGDSNNRGDGHNFGGYNDMGNNLPLVELPSGSGLMFVPTEMALLSGATCVLGISAYIFDIEVFCFGANFYGQLGLGHTNNVGDAVGQMGNNLNAVRLGSGFGDIVRLVAGYVSVCAVSGTGRVKCWGDNQYGTLGLGDTNNRGDQDNEMGDNLPYTELGTDMGQFVVTDIDCGAFHCCVLGGDPSGYTNYMKCWGHNQFGQLGYGDTNDRGDESGEMSDSLSMVFLGSGFLEIQEFGCSGYSTCAQNTAGLIKCFGQNEHGQLGLGNTVNRGVVSDQMGDFLPAVIVGSGFSSSGIHIAGGWGSHQCLFEESSPDLKVKCFGPNGQGQLGYGDTATRGDEMGNLPFISFPTNHPTTKAPDPTERPTPTPLQIEVTADAVVETSTYSTCALYNDNVQCWGDNAAGNLGLGDTVDRYKPQDEYVDFGHLFSPKELSCGGYHCCVISKLMMNTIKCWGGNVDGQLGYGDSNNRGSGPNEMSDNLPMVQLPSGFVPSEMALLRLSTCVLVITSSGNNEVVCFGDNAHGQLGLGHTNNIGDAVGQMGDNLNTVPLGSDFGDVMQLGAAGSSVCAVSGAGKVKCWGSNQYGTLGLGDTDDRGDQDNEMGDNLPFTELGTWFVVEDIDCGLSHCCVSSNGDLKCWGYNGYGQLGYGHSNNQGDESGQMGNNLLAVSLGSGFFVREFACSQFSTCVISTAGVLRCFGRNQLGQLGLGDSYDRGNNDNEMGDCLPDVDVGPGFSFSGILKPTHIAGGWGYHHCLFEESSTDLKVKCFGDNSQGQLGYDDMTTRGDDTDEMGENLDFISFPTNHPTTKAPAPTKRPTLSPLQGEVTANAVVETSLHSTCALYNDDVRCWGWNVDGQLGLGDTASHLEPEDEGIDFGFLFAPKELSCGGYHCCVISKLLMDTMKCWGENGYGQLGYGDMNDRGSGPNEMGNNLPMVELPSGFEPSKMALLRWSTCVLGIRNSAGEVVCFGYNLYGQLGLGHDNNIGDYDDEMGDNLNAVPLGSDFGNVKQLRATGFSVCAVSIAGKVKCWGDNEYGTLGLGDTNNRGDGPGEMGDHLSFTELGTGFVVEDIDCGSYHCCVLGGGDLKCWGHNQYGQLGYGDTNDRGDESGEMGNNLVAVSLGSGFFVREFGCSKYSTCAISSGLTDGVLKCFGRNSLGQLGLGDTDNRGMVSNQMGDFLTAVAVGSGFDSSGIHVAGGWSNHQCIFEESSTDLKLKCFGWNNQGQLGYGDKTTRGDGIDEMGENLDFVSFPIDEVNISTPEVINIVEEVSCVGGVYLSGFFYPEADGHYFPVSEQTDVYINENEHFLWKGDGDIHGQSGCDGYWKIGPSLEDSSYEERLGSNLLDPCDTCLGSCELWFYIESDDTWQPDISASVVTSCSVGLDVISPATDSANAAVPVGVEGVDILPGALNDESGSNDVLPMSIGAVIGSALIVAVAVLVVLMKKRKNLKSRDQGHVDAEHVPDISVLPMGDIEMEVAVTENVDQVDGGDDAPTV